MNQQQVVGGINIADYSAKKKIGVLTIAKIGAAHAIAVKRFSPETGKELPAEVFNISLENLEKQKAELLKSANDLQLLITDFEALE